MYDVEAELNSLGLRTPRTNADFADDARLHLVQLSSGFEVVAVPLGDDCPCHPIKVVTWGGPDVPTQDTADFGQELEE